MRESEVMLWGMRVRASQNVYPGWELQPQRPEGFREKQRWGFGGLSRRFATADISNSRVEH